ncbi:MAG: hypothetical protein AAFP84_11375 [Actinomycetota bacterium]
MTRRPTLPLLTLAATGLALVPATSAVEAGIGPIARVTNGADAGPGSFRAAVEAANTDPSINAVVFQSAITVELATAVEYTGDQSLSIVGAGSTVSGANGDPSANTTWNSGLFVSRSAADLRLTELNFEDSFNNGLAVFLPSDAGHVAIDLVRVGVSGSKFHGVFIDGQASTGFNSDDEPHPACVDPHFVDATGSIDLQVVRSSVSDNGTLLGGFDDSTATGCPRDFDGLRVDDGADGGIVAELVRSNFDGNLADGVELDEKGGGGVVARVNRSSFDGNGASGETVDGLEDLDDGFDIDEEGPGNLIARVANSTMNGNFDEGLDLDEAGPGDVVVTVDRSVADGNEDEGLKADEEDDGDLSFRVTDTSSSGSLSQDGVDLSEVGAGTFEAEFVRTTIVGNDNEGISAEQDDRGFGRLRVFASDLSGNNDGPVDADGIDVKLFTTVV